MSSHHIRLRAILAGLLVDNVSTFGATFLGYSVVGLVASLQHIPVETYSAALQGPLVEFFGFVLGMMFSAVGAVVTASLARPYCVMNALIFGIFTTLLGFCFAPDLSDILSLAALAVPPPMSVLIGWAVLKLAR